LIHGELRIYKEKPSGRRELKPIVLTGLEEE